MNFTILFGIVWFWMLVTILNNIVHQYCSVLFAVLLYIVLSRLGQNNPATIFVTKGMAGLTATALHTGLSELRKEAMYCILQTPLQLELSYATLRMATLG